MSMTSEELQDALRKGAKATYRDYFGQEFHGTVDSVTCRRCEGGIVVSVGIKDLKANSILEVKPERLSLMEVRHEV